AMHHLHRCAIDGHVLMHRDLKPDNIAFSLHKVIDFGLAKLIKRAKTDCRGQPLERYTMTGETGSPRYMAPECHLNLPYNEKVDVYSFGMCIWEMIELEVPFKDAKSLK
ncbi:kinase-like domain-containing protein, partial [Tribonema minus]